MRRAFISPMKYVQGEDERAFESRLFCKNIR